MSSLIGNELLQKLPLRMAINRLAVSQNYAQFSDVAKDVKISDLPNSHAHVDSTIPQEINVTKYDKVMLVWGGKFKRVADVPDKVRFATFESGRNKARIKTNLAVMGLAIVGCGTAMYLGKKDVKEGKTKESFYEEFKKSMTSK